MLRGCSSPQRHHIAAAGLVLYCVVLTVLTGDTGFDGDDWWVLGWAYWHQFPGSVLSYASEFLRPVEGAYWISLFEVFGFNKIAFQLFSFLLLAGSSILMGAALTKAVPNRPVLPVLAAGFAFFLPTVSCLTYILYTDNARLSLLFFWASVLLFQRWGGKSESWPGLIPPSLLYILSFFAYESPSFLVFAVPLLVFPVHRRNERRLPDGQFLLRLGAGILSAFVAALLVRFVLLSGGAVVHSHLLPPFELVWAYFALLPHYLIAPFISLSADPWPLVIGMSVVVWVGCLIFLFRTGNSAEGEPVAVKPGWLESPAYLVILGIGIVLLGMLPYQLAGYGGVAPKLVDTALLKWGLTENGHTDWFNFRQSSRIYSSATCGVAILLAVFATGWSKYRSRLVGTVVSLGALGLMASFHAGLSTDWKQAAQIRNEIIASLISQVPEVEPGTNFVCVDLECYHKRAAVIRGWSGLRELIRMLYDDRTLRAWFVYPRALDRPGSKWQQGFVLPDGFVSRGMQFTEPAPKNTLILLKRMGDSVELPKRISEDDPFVSSGICWRGPHVLRSNLNRIVTWSDARQGAALRAKNAWNSGLISSLHLLKVRLTARMGKQWTYLLPERGIAKRVLK